MAETLKELFIIKATSKFTGNIHYVEIDDDDCVNLVDHNSDASLYGTYDAAAQAIKDYCDGEETHEYTVDSIMMSLEEFMTEH